jgi:SecD/SecF fusion protein
MKSFTWKIVICVLPILIGAAVVGRAFSLYEKGQGGFNLGVDLVGGTILVYEVDESRWPDGVPPQEYSVEKLAAKLKNRIDPADLYNVTIRPIGKTRIEIILPTGGVKYAQHQEDVWRNLIDELKTQWPPREGHDDAYNVGLDQRAQLIAAVENEHAKDPDFKVEAVNEFIKKHLPAATGEKRRAMTGEQVQKVKDLISRVGSLKFIILANSTDDSEAFKEAENLYGTGPDKRGTIDVEKLKLASITGAPPPPPSLPNNRPFKVSLGDHTSDYTYTWVELGPEERHVYGLDNASSGSPFWKQMEEAREHHWVVVRPGMGDYRNHIFFSRKVENPDRLPERDRGKKYEYFMLTRDPERDENGRPKAVTGDYLIRAFPEPDPREGGIVVGFTFNSEGARLLGDLTSQNKSREMAIVLDDLIQSAPNIQEPITGGSGVIRLGNAKQEDIDRLVNILNSGALPASLKPQPVSENTMGSTLGADTIYWGTVSVVVAFVCVLAFMLVYYRFAGLVACVALFANLLLTVALMVLINATFTLPGLAGLVLTLGMAVDANVLIYERLREERERGASLALAIRNGYDRAFPTIIDTHLSSIFTAVVLYVVGNDQLKGFGISLTLGLIISLFTSLFMTRLMFDFWLAKGWLHKLSMLKLLSKPNIDFMAIRYYWFTATIVLTIAGAIVFLMRLDSGGLNIDFMGGTAYTGMLKKDDALNITQLREALDAGRAENKAKLAVERVEPIDDRGLYRIFYKSDGASRQVFVDKQKLPNGTTALVPPEDVAKRAETLPDLSVVQIFSQGYYEGDRSQLFTVRTQEKAAQLVQAAVGRLLAGKLEQVEMTDLRVTDGGRTATMTFSEPASPAQVDMLIRNEFEHGKDKELAGLANQFTLAKLGPDKEGRYQQMRFDLTATGKVDEAKIKAALEEVRQQLKDSPQPERLENFDAQLATDTQMRALYAILASWGAILLYLWFRFGNWTFGLAAVLCLIHDLFFTLGFIGAAHYIHQVWPNNFLLIQDFKIDLQSVAALLTLVGYSVSDTIVVFDRIREVRGKNPELTPKMINDSVNQTLSRTLLTAASVWLVVIVLYAIGGEGVHLFAFVMVIGVIVGTYSSIYIASPLLLIFGEGKPAAVPARQPLPQGAPA